MAHNISVDSEAYRILSSHKLDGKDSFSEVIKRNMAEVPGPGGWSKAVREALELEKAVKEVLKAKKENARPARGH